ncbi:MAG: S49 family peptidase, partial [Geminicoccaceae bacterium]
MLDRIKSLSTRLRWPPWGPKGPIVPVVRLSGVIGTGGGALRGESLSLQGVNRSLERAFKTKGAKAVALAINSPGGSPVQSALIADRIRTLAAEHELPVLAFIEDVGASGGYWLALAADEIFADV